MSLLNMEWYVVGPPWGDGLWINAGSEDPHGGRFVLDCRPLDDHAPSEEEAAELAEHIVKLHAAYLRAKAKVRATDVSVGPDAVSVPRPDKHNAVDERPAEESVPRGTEKA